MQISRVLEQVQIKIIHVMIAIRYEVGNNRCSSYKENDYINKPLKIIENV